MKLKVSLIRGNYVIKYSSLDKYIKNYLGGCVNFDYLYD